MRSHKNLIKIKVGFEKKNFNIGRVVLFRHLSPQPEGLILELGLRLGIHTSMTRMICLFFASFSAFASKAKKIFITHRREDDIIW